jgi:hypothetical protein
MKRTNSGYSVSGHYLNLQILFLILTQFTNVTTLVRQKVNKSHFLVTKWWNNPIFQLLNQDHQTNLSSRLREVDPCLKRNPVDSLCNIGGYNEFFWGLKRFICFKGFISLIFPACQTGIAAPKTYQSMVPVRAGLSPFTAFCGSISPVTSHKGSGVLTGRDNRFGSKISVYTDQTGKIGKR